MDDPAFFTAPEPIPAGEARRPRALPGCRDVVRRHVPDHVPTETVSGAPTVRLRWSRRREDRAPFGGRTRCCCTATARPGWPTPAHLRSRSTVTSTTATPNEFEACRNATNEGWVVAATDYEGLGGPGSHPMLVGVSEGRSMLDAGRARGRSQCLRRRHHRRRRLLPGWPRCAVGHAARCRVDAGAADRRHRGRLGGE